MENKAEMAGKRGPSGWLAEAGRRLEHGLAMREASGETAGRRLSSLAFPHGSDTLRLAFGLDGSG